MNAWLLCAALLAVLEASPTPSAAPTPANTPAPTASALPPVSTASPSAAPAPSPSGAATPAPYLYVYVPPASLPPSKILEINLNDKTLHAPGDVRVRVLTTNDVVSVVVRAMGREISVPRVVPGLFAAEDKIPHVPLFLRGRTYDIDFVAASGDGQSSTITLPIALAR